MSNVFAHNEKIRLLGERAMVRMRLFYPGFCALLMAVTVGFAAPGTAWAENRLALVMGNGAYTVAPALANPVNDARLVAGTLRDLGFDVSELIDGSKADMNGVIQRFGQKLARAGKDTVALFFYAGHGVQVAGRNYLIPVDAKIGSEQEVSRESMDANDIVGTMDKGGPRIKFIILDACRNNPFRQAGATRAVTRNNEAGGLAKMKATSGTLIAYSTSPDDVAADGTGGNSPYTAALAKALRKPNVHVERVFKDVRIAVAKDTDNLQVPWESSSLTGDFGFNGQPGQPQVAALEPPDREALFWASIKDSKDPANFQEYLIQYPRGQFAQLARNKIVQIKRDTDLAEPVQKASTGPQRPDEESYSAIVMVDSRGADKDQAVQKALVKSRDQAKGFLAKYTSIKLGQPKLIKVAEGGGGAVTAAIEVPFEYAGGKRGSTVDEPLAVRVWTEKRKYREGETVDIYLHGNKGFYARLIYRQADGTVVQLLPNKYRKHNRFLGDRTFIVPDGRDEFGMKVQAPFGIERLQVLASTEPLGDVKGQEVGGGLYVPQGTLAQVGAQSKGIGVVFRGSTVDADDGDQPPKPTKQDREFYVGTWKMETYR